MPNRTSIQYSNGTTVQLTSVADYGPTINSTYPLGILLKEPIIYINNNIFNLY